MTNKYLEGKGALITGAASGFGKGVAQALSERGADLVLVDLNAEQLEKTSAEIENKSGKKVTSIICDVSDSKCVKKMADQAFEEIGNVYILFNNAGLATSYGVDVLKLGEKAWDRTIDVNLKGQWLVDKFVCRKMNRQSFEPLKGKVIHTTSGYGITLSPFVPAYSISKAGVIALNNLLAKKLAPHITSNAIAPGYHVTGIYGHREDIMLQSMRDGHVKTPLNRIGTIEDVVNLVLFLTSSKSDFITGHCFPIDGGIAEAGVPSHRLEMDI
ncbi:MAG: SDR family NAD(P)-dependent oxidoreductase [Promethearchaeota archaeon]|jgi:NAD(P)-dependent dehydrogenase (short-subunit alcohol dehydrogenase family)